MRNIIGGLAILGALAAGPGALAAMVQEPAIQRIDWDGCGPRCQEHRREEWRRREWIRHQRWDEHRHWEESRGYR